VLITCARRSGRDVYPVIILLFGADLLYRLSRERANNWIAMRWTSCFIRSGYFKRRRTSWKRFCRFRRICRRGVVNGPESIVDPSESTRKDNIFGQTRVYTQRPSCTVCVRYSTTNLPATYKRYSSVCTPFRRTSLKRTRILFGLYDSYSSRTSRGPRFQTRWIPVVRSFGSVARVMWLPYDRVDCYRAWAVATQIQRWTTWNRKKNVPTRSDRNDNRGITTFLTCLRHCFVRRTSRKLQHGMSRFGCIRFQALIRTYRRGLFRNLFCFSSRCERCG